MLREAVVRHYRGPVAYANSTRCRPIVAQVAEKHVDACRGYLAATVADARPERIVALGAWAAYALMGRKVSPMGSRGAYAYLTSGRFGAPVPVYFLLHPAAALRNRFVRRWFEQDIARALTRPRPPMPPLDEVARVVETAADAEEAVREIARWPWAAFDVESAGLLFDRSFRLLCLSVAPERGDGDEAVWVWDEAALRDPATRGPLARWLASPYRKTGSNCKFDANAAKSFGMGVSNVDGDARLWRKLLEPEASGYLSDMVELVGMGGMKDEQAAHEAPAVDRIRFAIQTERRLARNEAAGKKSGKLNDRHQDSLAALADLEASLPHIAALARNPDVEPGAWSKAVVPPDVLLRYNARDALGTRRLCAALPLELAAVPPIDRIRRLVVDRAARAVARLEEWGVMVDQDALRVLESYCMLKVSNVRRQLDAMVGPEFNPGSHPQLADLLYGKLKLRPSKTTPGGKPSTDEESLERLRGKHPIADLILEHRKFSKINSNYAAGLWSYIRPDGRVHASILLDGTVTGRASIQDPALQTLPSPKKDPVHGKMCRDVYAAPPGYKILSFDYKQVEFRVAAMLSRDRVMIADIVAGRDPHMETARFISRLVWGIPPEACTEKHRDLSKRVVFGVLYGKTTGSLAAEFACSKEEAQKILDAVLGRYPDLARWIASNRREAQKTGCIWTMWAGEPARRRPIVDLASDDEGRRTHAENAATNSPIQGGANEFQLASLADSVEWIEGDGLEDWVKLLFPVHDALLFEVRDSMVDETVRVVKGIMTSHDSGGVPLGVDVETGQSWGSLVKYTPPGQG
jgi:DNA polymerase I-like protein with 3'-5' exonuclease and polymerase domains